MLTDIDDRWISCASASSRLTSPSTLHLTCFSHRHFTSKVFYSVTSTNCVSVCKFHHNANNSDQWCLSICADKQTDEHTKKIPAAHGKIYAAQERINRCLYGDDYKCLVVMPCRFRQNTRGVQKVLQLDTISNKLIFFIVDWRTTILKLCLHYDTCTGVRLSCRSVNIHHTCASYIRVCVVSNMLKTTCMCVMQATTNKYVMHVLCTCTPYMYHSVNTALFTSNPLIKWLHHL